MFVLAWVLLTVTGEGAPTIDPIPSVTIPAGKSLIVPVTATSPGGLPLTYTVTSNTNGIAVVMHTNNPFWQLTLAQAAPTNALGAYKTPFRGGAVTVTNVGTMTFMLFPEYAPHTINVFQGLTTSGFYNSNTIFHRVVSNFVIQGGDPQTNGFGGLVFQYDDEFNPQAIFSGNGQLALANSGKDTDGSQFFVTVGQQRFLDFGYPLFGQLVRGFGVLSNINFTAVDTNSRPLADEIIQSATYVTNTSDTVLTLTATNISGVTGTIMVIAADSAGGRATNTFTATTATDTNSNNNPIFYSLNSVTNLVAAKNHTLTNFITALELDGEPLYWFPLFGDQASLNASSNASINLSTNIFRSLTYNFGNSNGQCQSFLTATNNYIGPITVYFEVSSSSSWLTYFQYGLSLPPYDQQPFTFVFGDTPISGQSNAVAVLAGAAFTNVLVATFTNGVPGSAVTNFTASINWGDNSITAGTITTNGAGPKVVLGGHAYNYAGVYPVYVTVQSSIGASATILSYVTAITAPRLSLGASPPLGPNGFAFNLQIATGVSGSIQVSPDLRNWTTFTNFTATNSTLTFRDAAATNSNRRFYRAVVP
jgi:cyclophilin family peptidyl-prolyl cis-trans isomerase